MSVFARALIPPIALGVAAGASAAATLTGLGDLPGGAFASRAYDVSGDASVVVGESQSANGREAFRWTAADGMVGLGDLPGSGFESVATAASRDGSVVVGAGAGGLLGFEAFRWTATGGMVGLSPPLPPLPPFTVPIGALGVSGDGDLVAGSAFSFGLPGCFLADAFQWTPDTGSVRTCAPSTDGTENWAVSDDRSTVVGSLFPVEFSPVLAHHNWVPLRTAFGPFGSGPIPGRALATSADGSIVVGEGDFPSLIGAFRWREDATLPEGGVAQPLGSLPGGSDDTLPWDVSADGAVVVGASDASTGCGNSLSDENTSGCQAFLWEAEHGIRSLAEVLEADYGLDLTGWILREAQGISDDGLTIVGWGTNPSGDEEAWLAVLPPACNDGLDNDADGLVDLADTGCDDADDLSEQTSLWPCDDGVDNDEDGRVDFRADASGDLGCRQPAWVEDPQCQDGLNNDGKPGIDFDGGASVNGGVPLDVPDPQCAGRAWWNKEAAPTCGLGFEVAPILAVIAWRRRRSDR